MTRDSQFRNGYLARDQNLPRSNFFAGLNIAMEEKYDVHCMRLKDGKADNLKEMFDALIFPFFSP